jgi:hypothetical protein
LIESETPTARRQVLRDLATFDFTWWLDLGANVTRNADAVGQKSAMQPIRI